MTKICYARTARRTRHHPIRPVADEAIHPAADAAYRVDPETGEVLDSGAISDTDTEGLLL